LRCWPPANSSRIGSPVSSPTRVGTSNNQSFFCLLSSQQHPNTRRRRHPLGWRDRSKGRHAGDNGWSAPFSPARAAASPTHATSPASSSQ
jgi:hypothetical protein